MVTSKDLPKGSVVIKPRRGSAGGAALILLLLFLTAGAVALAGLGIFSPASLAAPQERILGMIHGGVADTAEETYVDGCVQIPGADGPRAVTRTRRTLTFRDGTSLEVVFSGAPALTNACP
ncbi:hypothetical protein K2Z83_00810 [Oscillochloris sp. ZM17-4]|uniref:hypothetical protein n=1 Tax=Oscillochloris sp. ZM17-4 TaxID=2866714 RepID=UPI001C732B34|nr:hypothetical protein [Oscillochloris sp. ZM17-4]MBX0326233.1 hypothetical protein [Oscillochloris sp. ZM17-4]